jgi:hypothetical protein
MKILQSFINMNTNNYFNKKNELPKILDKVINQRY